MDIQYVTSLLSHLRLKEWLCSSWIKVCGSQSDRQLAFRNILKGKRYYRAKKHIREDLILPELLSDYLSDVPDEIFQ
jgi:hypothetical protein